MLLSMLTLGIIETDGIDGIDAVAVALIIGVVMAVATCYFAVSVSRHGYGKLRNSMLIACGVLCGLSVGFAVVVWLIFNGGS
jgi:hypothetical protein